MCNVCGCGAGETRIEGEALDRDGHAHEHVHADGTVHRHAHGHEGEHAHSHQWVPAGAHGHLHRHADGTWHSHDHVHTADHAHPHTDVGDGSLHYGHGPAGAHAPGMSQAQMVKIEQNILAKNDGYAERNRGWLADRGILALNLVSSPGSGKTTLLVRTIEALKSRVPVAVVEGDQQTSFDAERIRATGAPALQINTGKGCHLDAHMVGRALEKLAPADDSVLLIENVGNLVCPAAFDLGEAAKVVVLSVTEGEDKPLLYPDMFAAASLMLVNKIDLLPYLNFPVDKAIEYALRVNPQLQVIQVSATTGAGFDAWLGWIDARLAEAVAARTR
jgi:hydrogenase nickel incorporation protein HypB